MPKNGLSWANEKRKLSDLVPWPRNPRQIDQEDAGRLSESLDEFGQVEVIAIGPGNEVYNGHQRLSVWAEEHGPDLQVDVRVSSRPLTEKEREKLTIFLHQGAVGEWDFDTLMSEFELPDLLNWGFDESDLGLSTKPPKGKDEGDLDISPELHERHDYLVFYFDNTFDWQVACETFDVKRVKCGPVGNKTVEQKGLGRVIPGTNLLEALGLTPSDRVAVFGEED